MAKATKIVLSREEKETLLSWQRAGKTEKRMAERAQMILEASEGKTNMEIAKMLSTRSARISKWRTRFAMDRLAGIYDAARPGKPVMYDDSTGKKILSKLDEPLPKGYAKWIVICVDEKPHIQALERAQGWLKLPDGKALAGFSHNYKRHGTTTLFAALEVTTGLVRTGHYQRRRRTEFLDFMNRVVAEYPDKEIHVILDNLGTHKPKRDMWLKRNKNVHFHYTPTYSSWLNQVECWFSILSRNALKGASFTSPQQVRKAIDDFVEVYNENAAPFEWTKRDVYPKKLKKLYADLCN